MRRKYVENDLKELGANFIKCEKEKKFVKILPKN